MIFSVVTVIEAKGGQRLKTQRAFRGGKQCEL